MIYYDKDKKPLTDLSYNIDAPIGTLAWYCFRKIPKGWLLCDGSSVSKSKYAKLFQVIGNKFGEAESKDRFLLPNSINHYIEQATLDENGIPIIGYKSPSAPDFDARFGYPDIWQSGQAYSGAFYQAAALSAGGYNNGASRNFTRRSISVDFSLDENHGSVYAEDKVIVPHRSVYIIIKAENITDDKKLLAKVEVI